LEKKRIIVCPVCGSPKIRKLSSFSGWLTPEIWVCPECGYKGPIYAEKEVELRDKDKEE